MEKAIIYCRCSTLDQSTDRQLKELSKVADTKGFSYEVITEYISGASKLKERKGIQLILEKARSGDFQHLVVSELSRLGRSLQTIQLIEELTELGINIHIQDLGISTLDKEGNMSFVSEIICAVMSIMAKGERTTMIERVRQGMALAKANGVHCGRAKGTFESVDKFLKKYPKAVHLIKKEVPLRDVSKLALISLSTAQKIKHSLQQAA